MVYAVGDSGGGNATAADTVVNNVDYVDTDENDDSIGLMRRMIK